MTVPGGCRSQGCHGTLLGSLAAPFCFIRHLPDTHLLLMGLIKVGVSVIPSAEKKKTYHHRVQEVCLLLELSAPAQQAFSEINENEKFIIKKK